MSIASVALSKVKQLTSHRLTNGARAAFDARGLADGSFYQEVSVEFGDREVAASAGKSAGMRLPLMFAFVHGACFGKPMSQAAWTALGTDDLRDNAFIAPDSVYPVGSIINSFQPILKPGATAGGFAGLVYHGTPNAAYPQGIMIKIGTAGAPGTATWSCSTDGGTTWGTAYATTASAINVVKDSANADTGLRVRLATGAFGSGDTATIDLNAPGGAKLYQKTAPETWTDLTA